MTRTRCKAQADLPPPGPAQGPQSTACVSAGGRGPGSGPDGRSDRAARAACEVTDQKVRSGVCSRALNSRAPVAGFSSVNVVEIVAFAAPLARLIFMVPDWKHCR
jgi:hypothetical protein